MKIAFIVTYFYPLQGGEGINAYHLAKELAKKYDVHVFTSDRKGKEKLKEEEIINKIKVHRCKVLFRIGYHGVFYPSLTARILKEKFDIIHFFSFGILQHDFTLTLKKMQHQHTVFINTPAHQSFVHGVKGAIGNFFIKSFEKLINKLYDIVIAISKGQEKWMSEWGIDKKKIKIITPGISEENFQQFKYKSKKFNLKNKFVISYVGRIQKYKGLDQVVRILPHLLRINKNIVFLCVGKDAGDKKRLVETAKKLKIEKNVVFTSEVSEKEKISLLGKTDIFVLPSKIEGFGIVLLEAMAQGKAVVSTKTDGGKFLIENGKNGYLYNYSDLSKLKEIMIKLIKNKNLRKKLGKEGLIKSKQFRWQKIALQLENVYKTALKI